MTTKPAAKATTTSIYKPGNLYQVAPGVLVLERNIRDAKPDAELLASVSALGVLSPITAVVGVDGRLVVRLGHRRTLAAVETGRDTVPVYVAALDDTADLAEVGRIIEQHDENTVRAGLTAGDELGVVEQLAAFGLSADEISAQARIGKDRVATAMTVSGSELATKATARYESMTLEQAATVAEFDGDAETAKTLIVAAVETPESFAHIAQRARDERIRDRFRDQLLAELKDAGVPVVKQPMHDDKPKRLSRLRDEKGKELTEATHRGCGGHVAWLGVTRKLVDADGNLVTERGDGVREIQLPAPEYGCKDLKKFGHIDSYAISSGRPKAADLSPAEREKAKDERRLVIENNKAWDAAEVVRREWLVEFAKRKTPPKGTAAFIAGALASDRYILTHEGNQTTREKLCTEWGMSMKKHGSYNHRVDVPAGTTEARALMIALVQVLAAHESSIDRMDWRRDGKTERHGRYLAFLQSAGYGLSDVEKFALSSKTVS